MMIIAPPPDQAAVNAWLQFLTPIALAVVATIQIVAAKLAANRGAAAQTTAAQLDTKLTAVHQLVNSDHTTALNLAATALEKVAGLTNNPADLQQAVAARTQADAHQRNQAAGAAAVPTPPQSNPIHVKE